MIVHMCCNVEESMSDEWEVRKGPGISTLIERHEGGCQI